VIELERKTEKQIGTPGLVSLVQGNEVRSLGVGSDESCYESCDASGCDCFDSGDCFDICDRAPDLKPTQRSQSLKSKAK
jgi:hypothetical protein